jgi:CheY-like chemotaxis protein
MPFMDGYEASKRVREILDGRNVRIVAVTGHIEQEYITKAKNYGIDMVYPKPLPILYLGRELKDFNFINFIP